MTGMHARASAMWAIARDNPVLPVIAGIGFAVSFQTISAEARARHMPGWPLLYPLLIDVFLLGLVVESRKAIDDGRSDLVPRALAWLLSGFTLYVNAHGSPPRDWVGIALHVTAPVAWITFLELTRWRKLRRKRAERQDRIPLARWLIAFRRTAGMRKRMILHNVTSYAEASAREEARLLGIDLAAAVFGARWRKDAPALLVHHLREGTLPADVAQACQFGSRELPDRVDAWIAGAHSARARAVARARQEFAGIPTAAAAAAPRPGPRRPRQKRARSAASARARAEAMIRANPAAGTSDVVAATGASKSTVLRIKRDVAGRPSLSVAR